MKGWHEGLVRSRSVRHCSNLQGGGGGGAYLVGPGTPLERHLPHVLAVIFRNTARLDQGRHQVILDGLEL